MRAFPASFSTFFFSVRLPLLSEADHIFFLIPTSFRQPYHIFGDWTFIFQIPALYFQFICFWGEVLI
uniref:Putative ovule protein n=1 Tax=Solanum chacoense TaxID=4108 RepID=A0A0V0GQU2_SOLCH